ncbi:hypothetical protein TW85_01330 [Marinomonas sp. S3726]|uniref:hypothetical protein n=1 Tax=Marinomonas sp. S3726 TaxID=579484 RepID=UPI0005FA5D1A|nr:hypothetical protein [Marinomonas sp. S3726]KJZ15581.1 hypothetical protein TW85_01330 [Marinomonas sp. S3726]
MTKFFLILSLGLASVSHAQQYFSFGLKENSWLKQSDEQKYALDHSQYQTFQYGYSGPIKPAVLVDISLDKEEEVREFSISYVWQEHFFQIDQGVIAGTTSGNADNADGTFFNTYKQLLILKKRFKDSSVMLGTGYRTSEVPHLFKYSNQTLQDDALKITTFGVGIYNDPIYHYIHSDEQGERKDWYFSTSAVLGLSQATASNANALSNKGVNGESWLLYGAQGNYELGYFYGFKNENYSLAVNIGYQVQSDILLSARPFDLFDSTNNELSLSSLKRITHGPSARINYAF